jgi:hypothetical protein
LPAQVLAAGLTGPLTPQQRQRLIFDRRREAAQSEYNGELPLHETNGDEDRYPDRRAAFTKTMPHNDLGEVVPAAYRKWLAILASGDSTEFEQAPRDTQAAEQLNDPQAAYAIELAGPDATALPFPPPPAFASLQAAAEMTELYWRALLRDLPFRLYGTDPLVPAAVADLRATGYAEIGIDRLFRGEVAGDLRGPFVSQFLWQDIPFGLKTVDQRFRLPSAGQSFLTAFEIWLACQRGARQGADLHFDPEPRYIATYRGLTEYVHRDFSFQSFMDAALLVFHLGAEHGADVWSPTNPYRGSRSQFGDITFGNKNLLSLLAQASLLAQKTAYYQKWQIHRRARPECLGGRIEVHLTGRKSYDIHPAVLESEALARVKAANGSHLLPMAYPEGCPTHPSYPAAHGVNAGACATVLKAFVNEACAFPGAVEASPDGTRLDLWRGETLTLGGEIDKEADGWWAGPDNHHSLKGDAHGWSIKMTREPALHPGSALVELRSC